MSPFTPARPLLKDGDKPLLVNPEAPRFGLTDRRNDQVFSPQSRAAAYSEAAVTAVADDATPIDDPAEAISAKYEAVLEAVIQSIAEDATQAASFCGKDFRWF